MHHKAGMDTFRNLPHLELMIAEDIDEAFFQRHGWLIESQLSKQKSVDCT